MSLSALTAAGNKVIERSLHGENHKQRAKKRLNSFQIQD